MIPTKGGKIIRNYRATKVVATFAHLARNAHHKPKAFPTGRGSASMRLPAGLSCLLSQPKCSNTARHGKMNLCCGNTAAFLFSPGVQSGIWSCGGAGFSKFGCHLSLRTPLVLPSSEILRFTLFLTFKNFDCLYLSILLPLHFHSCFHLPTSLLVAGFAGCSHAK